MPSFLSKLLGRKKVQGLEPSSVNPGYPAPLLEGKFEAISPNVSPSAAFFTDPSAAQIRGNDRPKDKESPFYIFRARARGSSDAPTVEKAPSDVPHLSLNLPITKDRGPSLDVVFESDPDAFALSSETDIRERRLTPYESLALVRACSQVIIESGLETLGIMHPHWHSTSPAVQQRLISLYLISLASTSPDGVTSPTSPTAVTTFESELQYTRSPHDVAAVLRWGLRHLKLEGDSFGKESGDWTWYNTFTEAERAGSYPGDAFSNSLIPQLPTAHAELLLATLDIISSLSTRSEANGSSGSKLSKFFGLWLLTSEQSTEGDDWSALYDRWDRAGRILEHLFLARIRNDAHSLPRRLTDLVEHYPYDYGVGVPKNDLLPRPRFSTRQFDALFVQLDTEYTGSVKPTSHPLRLIADAFHAQSSSESTTAEDDGLWDAIKKASFDTSEGPDETAPTEPIPIFANVFSDETIRLLSLIPADASDKDKSAPTFALRSPVSPGVPRSFSLPETPLLVHSERGRPPPSGHAIVVPGISANNSTAPTTALPETPTDWLQFSNRGFGTIPGSRDLIAKLWDDDVEKTVPPTVPLSPKSSHRAHSRHSSVDDTKTPVQSVPPTPASPVSKVTLVAKIKLDEAFIDFWTDSLLDPISKRWPRFVLCHLKPFSPADASATHIPAWLVIEQRFVHPPPVSPVKEAEVTVPPARPRASSPHPSPRAESSRLSAAFSIVSKKRFGLFTGGNGDPKSPKDKAARLPQVGEYGDLSKETEDGTAATEKPEEVGAKDNVDGGALSSTADAGVPIAVVISAAAVASAAEEVKPKEDDLPAISAVAAQSELADISVLKADAPMKDEPPHGAASQNGRAHDEHHDEEQCEPEPEAATPQGPIGDNDAVIPPVTGDPIKTEAEPTQLEPECVLAAPDSAGIDDALVAQAIVAHPEPEPLVQESVAVVESSAPESSSTLVEEATPVEEDRVPAVPDAVISVEPTPTSAASKGVARDSPSEPASAAVPLPVSEQPAPEDDLQTVGEMQVAATTDLAQVIVEDPSAAEPEPVRSYDTIPAIQAISADEGLAFADAAETTVLLEEPAPVMGEVIVEDAQPVVIPERDDTVLDEHYAKAATPEPETIPASLADDTVTPSLENAESAATQAGLEEIPPSAEPDAEHDAFVTQSVEGGLPSQATPQIQDPVLDEHPSAEETTPIPEPSASESIPAEDLATSHDDEAVAAPPESAVADDAPVTGTVSGEAPAPSENSPSEMPVTEPVPVPEPSTQSSTNDSTESNVFRAEQLDTGEPDTANPVDEVLGLKAEADIVAEDQAPRKESESVIPLGEPPAPVPEISTFVIEEPAPPTEAELPVEAPAPVIQETDVTAEEIAPAAAETPAPTLEPATDDVPAIKELEIVIPVEEPSAPVHEIPTSVIEEPAPPTEAEIPVETPAPVIQIQETDATTEEATPAAAETPVTTLEPSTDDAPAIDVTAPKVAEPSVEAPVAAPVEPDVSEVLPVPPNALAVESAFSIEESTPSMEGLPPVHDQTLATEQSPAVPEERTPLPEETAPPIPELLAEPAPITEELTLVTEAAAPAATEAPAEPAAATEEAAPTTTEAPAEPTSVSEVPAPINEAAAPATIEPPTEAPADPAWMFEETAPDAEAVVPATENPSLEQFNPDLNETPAPPDEPAPVHEEEEPTVPEPPVEDPAPVHEDPAPASESAMPTADDTPAECVEEGAEGSPRAETAAEPASFAEEDASGLEGTVGAEPAAAAEEEPAAISSSETPAIAAQEPLSVEANADSELGTPMDASVPSKAIDATNAEPNAEAEAIESADDA